MLTGIGEVVGVVGIDEMLDNLLGSLDGRLVRIRIVLGCAH